ncbi:uncharacterized protein CLUP02_11230 [Colletotrichum lupini]|uniref:Zn(2)-C6 fungal-type domain-containing protein n=1 Tax=Colletotrichum lupini TaxID=145971 RepID=A0A9Q8WJM1_9PEZI|nr:uncharacterized protein CLUP02_11230 [Colletotrichum lupini]UQC85731.1 hypothetical protein CLUP02_11230 [Colletotrichum lupini]
MVSPAYYADGRRYSRVDPTYVYPERQQRHHSHSSEARTSNMTERETDTDTPPRKRIAVACGRCRKRKIRCSGDTGNGLPCQNCKAAGAESCMFLRVASTEAPWVSTDQTFTYDLKAARAYAHTAMASPLNSSPPHHYTSDIHDGLPRYSSTSASYYGGKYYASPATMPSWSATPGYSEDAVDYSPAAVASMGYPYSYQQPSDTSYYYRVNPTAKVAAAAPSAGDLYVNTADAVAAAGYAYGSNAGTVTQLPHRPATNVAAAAAAAVQQGEGQNFSFTGVAASLPPAGGDRRLPDRATRQPVANANVLAYRTEGAAAATSSTASASTKSSGSPTSQPSPISDVTTSYTTSGPSGSGSFETSPVSAYPPPSHTVPSMTHQQQRISNAEMAGYPPSTTTSGGNEPIFSASESSLRSASDSDLSYKYTDSSTAPSGVGRDGSGRRGSGETTSSTSSSSSTTPVGGGGSLSNGQQYTVTTPSPGMTHPVTLTEYATALFPLSYVVETQDAIAGEKLSFSGRGGTSPTLYSSPAGSETWLALLYEVQAPDLGVPFFPGGEGVVRCMRVAQPCLALSSTVPNDNDNVYAANVHTVTGGQENRERFHLCRQWEAQE